MELKAGPAASSRPKPARPKPAPKPKPKCGPTPANPQVESPINDDGDNIYEFADLPLVYPNDGYKDLVPANPSVALMSQLRQWSHFKKTNRTPNDAFASLSFSLYTEYYLIPWVAIHLIAEDLDCSLEIVYEDMIASAKSGFTLHPMAEEDRKVEAIIRQHCISSAEKRVTKIESFHEEMRVEVEKAIHSKDQQQVQEFMCRYVLSTGPSKFPGSYDDGSELSNLPDSNIQATSSRRLPPGASRK
ncbi:hypothetical protein AZE42_11446 [Rhizopogon vesiculosus]|uniref:Uncharacterized protein n=1 Tax=Rhizopogon vesiculosus TaxID=180088 RepID=A0A1J8R6E1_9AGAM|nr:hypothetical protein AZE42_11446 [Rhizopogon vesiculosus]